MKKRKLFLGFLAMGALVIGLAACDKKDTKPSDTNTPSENTPQENQKTLSSIEVSGGTKSFHVGDTFNKGNLVVTAKYSDNSTETVTTYTTAVKDSANTVVTGAFAAAGTYIVTVTYEGKTASYDVVVETVTPVGPTAEDNTITMNGTKYDTIKGALAAIPTTSTDTFNIVLGKGTYKENGLNYNGSATIKISGATTEKYGADVIIEGRGSNMGTMRGRELLEIQGSASIILENLTLKSDYDRATAGVKDVQAEVLGTDTTGKTVAYNCGFKSHQDTLRTTGKAWFYQCYIEGDTDFIWMEANGQVALYENCEIVSLYDAAASTHSSYICAPKMAEGKKIGKGLVIFNSKVYESEDAKNKGQKTYLARTPWQSGCYNQVAYINTTCEGIETPSPWYGSQIKTDYLKTVVGWKMDQATATSLGYAGNDDIIDATTTANEFGGRKAILNRVFNTGKLKYEKDTNDNWDIDALIQACGWVVDQDNSSDLLAGEVESEVVIYKFDGTEDQTALCSGFEKEANKSHYKGGVGATITIPVKGTCFVEVEGYYAGNISVTAGTQGEAYMFFNNGSTSKYLSDIYAVYQADAGNVVITAIGSGTTYITKVVVTYENVSFVPVSSIEISSSTKTQSVGVAVTLTASVNGDATNKTIKWSSSDPSVGTIDEYTGKVTFKAAGEVTFTATATDGSGVTETITCNPIAPVWEQCEWYTTDDTIDTEDGADGIGNFDVGKSSKKNLDEKVTFKNLAGDDISTNRSLKLNSAGSLTISTTKAGTLTLYTAHVAALGDNSTLAPKVADGNTVATLSSTEKVGSLMVYTYKIPGAGTWVITRAGGNEEDPLVYAKMVYPTKVEDSVFFTFKGSAWSAPTGATTVNVNDGTNYSFDNSEITVNCVTFKGLRSNGSNNWAAFGSGATITFTTADVAKVSILCYDYANHETVVNGSNTITGKPAAVSNNGTEYCFFVQAGKTVVTFNDNNYLGYICIVIGAVDEEPSTPAETGTVSTTTGFNFKGGAYSGTNYVNCNNADAGNIFTDASEEYVVAGATFKGIVSNGSDNWAAVSTTSTIKFNVVGPCTIKIAFYQGQNTAVVTLDSTAVSTTTSAEGATDTTKYEYTITAAGEVEITFTGSGYIGVIEVVYSE